MEASGRLGIGVPRWGAGARGGKLVIWQRGRPLLGGWGLRTKVSRHSILATSRGRSQIVVRTGAVVCGGQGNRRASTERLAEFRRARDYFHRTMDFR